mgnify:CR=1 FL=1
MVVSGLKLFTDYKFFVQPQTIEGPGVTIEINKKIDEGGE